MKRKIADLLRRLADRLHSEPEKPVATQTENGWTISFRGVPLANISTGSVAR